MFFKYSPLFFLLIIPQSLYSQKNIDSLKQVIDSLSIIIDSVKSENFFLKGRIVELENLKEVLLNQIKREDDFAKDKSPQKQTNQKNNVDKKEKVNRQCKAILKNGKRCSRRAQEGSDYCWQHQNKNKG